MIRGAVLACLLLLALPALAVDGDALTGGCNEGQGDLECHAYILCDSDTTASTCPTTMFNLGTGKPEGYPSYFVVTLLHETGCTAGAIEVQVRGAHVADSDEVSLVTANLQTDGIRSKSFVTDFKFVDAVLSGSFAGCTDIDVALVLYYER